MVAAVIVMHVRDQDVLHLGRLDADGVKSFAWAAAQQGSPSLAGHSFVEARVHHEHAPAGLDHPDEIIDGHGAIVNVAAQEILPGHAVMVRVAHGVNFPDAVVHIGVSLIVY